MGVSGSTSRALTSSATCCIRRDEAVFGYFGSSIFGEDATYREAFHDCRGEHPEYDHMFPVREQADLKLRKGALFVDYASFELKSQARAASVEIRQCVSNPERESCAATSSAKLARCKSIATVQASDDLPQNQAWLGTTMPKWVGSDLPPTGEGPYWSNGNGARLKVRCGGGRKRDSDGSMYEALTCDAIKSDTKIEDIMGRLVTRLPPHPDWSHVKNADKAGGDRVQWTRDCPLPRVIFINVMLPYTAGLRPFGKDGGCSFVGAFHIKPETLQAMASDHAPACVKSFLDFCRGPAGAPGGPPSDPDRSLARRLLGNTKKDQQSGLFKVMAKCLNTEDVAVPPMFHAFNGKPALITKSGYIVKDPHGEWLEIGVDVRGFNMLARQMLSSFRHLLPRTKIHYGFVIQGVSDEELPEGILCDMCVHGIDIMDDPLYISNTN